MSTKRDAPWLVMHDGTYHPAGTIECKRCGYTYLVTMPVAVDVLVGIERAINKAHRSCKRKPKAVIEP